MTTPLISCATCERYKDDETCSAFPEGIPTAIINGDFWHNKQFDDEDIFYKGPVNVKPTGLRPVQKENTNYQQIVANLSQGIGPIHAQEELSLAIHGEHDGYVIFVNEKDEIASAASWEYKFDNIWLLHLGSIREGGGAAALLYVVDKAIEKNRGLYLESTTAALEFYEKFDIPVEKILGIAKVSRNKLKQVQQKLTNYLKENDHGT